MLALMPIPGVGDDRLEVGILRFPPEDGAGPIAAADQHGWITGAAIARLDASSLSALAGGHLGKNFRVGVHPAGGRHPDGLRVAPRSNGRPRERRLVADLEFSGGGEGGPRVLGGGANFYPLPWPVLGDICQTQN